MTPDEGTLLSKTLYSGSSLVNVGNGTLLPMSNFGNLKLGTSSRPLCLRSVLHVPQLHHNLMSSVKQVCRDNNFNVTFNDSCVRSKDNTMGKVLLQESSVGNIYPIHITSSHTPANVAVREPGDVWHQRLGHCGASFLNCLRKFNLIQLNSKFDNKCMACRLSKSHRLLFE